MSNETQRSYQMGGVNVVVQDFVRIFDDVVVCTTVAAFEMARECNARTLV